MESGLGFMTPNEDFDVRFKQSGIFAGRRPKSLSFIAIRIPGPQSHFRVA
jgi:hypothetical protein